MSSFFVRFTSSSTQENQQDLQDALLFNLQDGQLAIRKDGLIQAAGSFVFSEQETQKEDEFFVDLHNRNSSDMQHIIMLPEKYCLHKRHKLPRINKGDIRAVLENQIDRLSPFKAEQVYFDYRIVEEKKGQDHWLIDLYILPRKKCEAPLQTLEAHDIHVDSLLLENKVEPASSVNFLSPLIYQDKQNGVKPDFSGKLWGAGALLVVLYLLPLVYNQYQISILKDKISLISDKAIASAKVKNSYERLRKETRFLVDKKKARPLSLRFINEISSVLKDESWLDQLSLKSDTIQLLGYSESASKVLNNLEQSHMLQDAHFMAAVVHNKKFDAERFHIAVRIAENIQKQTKIKKTGRAGP